MEGSACRTRINAIRPFWPGLWPDLGSGDPIQPGLRPRRAAVLERLAGRLAAPRRGARLAASAADEEVVEGASDLLAIAALEDLRVDLQGDLRVAVADLGHDVGDLRAGGEHHRDVGPPQSVRRHPCGQRRQVSQRPAFVGAPDGRSYHARVDVVLVASAARPGREEGALGRWSVQRRAPTSRSSRSIGLRSTLRTPASVLASATLIVPCAKSTSRMSIRQSSVLRSPAPARQAMIVRRALIRRRACCWV